MILLLNGLNLRQFRGTLALLAVVLFVDGNNAGSSQTEIVLKGVFEVGNLSLVGDSSELPAQLGTLCEPSGSKGVALTGETS